MLPPTQPLRTLLGLAPSDDDDDALQHLLDATLVITAAADAPALPAAVLAPAVDSSAHAALVDAAVRDLAVRDARLRSENVLVRQHLVRGAGSALVAELKSAPWVQLHRRIGPDALRHLLTERTLLRRLERRNLHQLTGPALFNAVAANAAAAKPAQPAAISRVRLFYGRPALVRAGGDPAAPPRVLAGLPRDHVLRCRDKTVTGPDLARAIASDGKRGLHRLGWRWQACAPLLQQLIDRQRTTNYRVLLDRHCPLPRESLRDTHVRGLLQLHATHEQVDAFLRAVLRRVVPAALLGSKHNHRKFNDALRVFVALRRNETMIVNDFCRGLRLSECAWVSKQTASMQPQPPSYQQAAAEAMRAFVRWLLDDYVVPLLKTCFYVTETTSYRNRVFYFRHELWRQMAALKAGELVRSAQLVPTSRKAAQEIFATKNVGFSEVRLVPKHGGLRLIVNLARRQPLTELRLRALQLPRDWLEDDGDARPSAWAQRVSQLAGARTCLPSINTRLATVFCALNMEKDRLPALLGASVFGMHDVHVRLRSFKHTLRERGLLGQPLYIAAADVKSSFDSIKQEKLLDIMRLVLRQSEYAISKYCLLQTRGAVTRRLFGQCASSVDMPGTFLRSLPDLASLIAGSLRGTVIVGAGVPRIESTRNILRVLQDHIRYNMVKIGSQLYRQREGVAQGSKVSTLLCSFYYGELETRHLAEYLSEPDELLQRFVDDYIFISPRRERVEKLLRTLVRGFPQYGFSVNPAKTLANFPMVIDGALAVPQSEPGGFPWIGLLLDQQLNVRHDWSRLACINVEDSLTLTAAHIGAGLRNGTIFNMKPGTHAVFVDATLNEAGIVLQNALENMLLCACKFFAGLREARRRGFRPQSTFVQDTISNAVNQHALLLQSRFFRLLADSPRAAVSPALGTEMLRWIGLRGFQLALERRPAQELRNTLTWLSKQTSPKPSHWSPDFLLMEQNALSRLSVLFV